MRYLKVRWIHEHPDEPSLIYSELCPDNTELRKVEILEDGTVWAAGAGIQTGSCWLSEEAIPSDEEIALDSQFILEEIGRDEFEVIWSLGLSASGR